MPANRKNKPVLLNLDGTLLKEIKFDKFKFGADQIMLISGDSLYAVANDGAKIYAVLREFSFSEIYRQSRSVR